MTDYNHPHWKMARDALDRDAKKIHHDGVYNLVAIADVVKLMDDAAAVADDLIAALKRENDLLRRNEKAMLERYQPRCYAKLKEVTSKFESKIAEVTVLTKELRTMLQELSKHEGCDYGRWTTGMRQRVCELIGKANELG